MRTTLLPEIFAPPIDHTLLISLFRYAIEGRHRVEADLQDSTIGAWLQLQSINVQEEIAFAVDSSAEEEALQPSATHLLVGQYDRTNWNVSPAQVRLEDARVNLDTPFSIVLEDATSDRDFLLKMLTAEERKFINDRLSRGFLRIEHGGGLPRMRNQIMQRANIPSAHCTTWVLFDSDALRPGKPSTESELLRATCGKIPHHQLKRRFAESYLPAPALRAWAAWPRKRRLQQARFAVLEAFLNMRREQRHHFNLKNGFAQDSRRTDASAGDLYEDLTERDKALLNPGFEEKIGELFAGDTFTEQDIRADSGWSELRPALTKLLAAVR